MSEEAKYPCNYNSTVTIPDMMFGALLGIAAVACIWLSSTLLIHLYQNLL